MKWLHIWRNKPYRLNFPVYLKCGINTGFSGIGLLESGSRKQFTAFGREINLASRLEGKAKKNGIIISKRTKKIIAGKFTFQGNLIQTELITLKKGSIQSFPWITEIFNIPKVKGNP